MTITRHCAAMASASLGLRLLVPTPAFAAESIHPGALFPASRAGDAPHWKLGMNLAFRSEQSAVTSLNNWAVTVAGPTGAATVCNFRIL